MKLKTRLDQFVQKMAPTLSRRQIQDAIAQGAVRVNGVVVTRPGVQIADDAQVTYEMKAPEFVGRAGFKLQKALDHFGIDVAGLVVLDAGLSTGGFADCLLQRGVKKVYGVYFGHLPVP